jgi:hypothetical protein
MAWGRQTRWHPPAYVSARCAAAPVYGTRGRGRDSRVCFLLATAMKSHERLAAGVLAIPLANDLDEIF